uniref:Uncharacterized protein n=1 Tax=Caenorhabditis tropicalis TaxID=1561998 RepID=A0A1I7U9K8_9PELO
MTILSDASIPFIVAIYVFISIVLCVSGFFTCKYYFMIVRWERSARLDALKSNILLEDNFQFDVPEICMAL